MEVYAYIHRKTLKTVILVDIYIYIYILYMIYTIWLCCYRYHLIPFPVIKHPARRPWKNWWPEISQLFHLGISINGGGSPKWLVQKMENPHLKWMITRNNWGYPHDSANFHIPSLSHRPHELPSDFPMTFPRPAGAPRHIFHCLGGRGISGRCLVTTWWFHGDLQSSP